MKLRWVYEDATSQPDREIWGNYPLSNFNILRFLNLSSGYVSTGTKFLFRLSLFPKLPSHASRILYSCIFTFFEMGFFSNPWSQMHNLPGEQIMAIAMVGVVFEAKVP
jgi:hypothetical protein